VPYQSDLPPQTNETPVDVSVYGSPPRAPPLPPPPAIAAGFGLPGFTQKTRTHDPFSWEAQESEIEQHGGALLPPRLLQTHLFNKIFEGLLQEPLKTL